MILAFNDQREEAYGSYLSYKDEKKMEETKAGTRK